MAVECVSRKASSLVSDWALSTHLCSIYVYPISLQDFTQVSDFEHIYILGTLNNTFKQNCSELHNSVQIAESISGSSEQNNIGENNIAEVIDERLKGRFLSPNVINLSTRILSKSEISLLSNGLKFIPTTTSVNKALIKEELECFGRKLRLLWHFRNEESIIISNKFKKKSTFKPKGKDAAIQLYLSRLEGEIMAIDTKSSYYTLTKEECLALNSLRDDTSIIIKEADKSSGVVVWDRKDYLKEAEKQLGDKETYEELSSDPLSPLISIVEVCLSRVKGAEATLAGCKYKFKFVSIVSEKIGK